MATLSIVLASSNQGKLHAFERLLHGLPVRLHTPQSLGISLNVAETGDTYVQNSLLKARAYRDAAGMGALADDSGLMVDALDGEPGVHSARFGGYGDSPTAQNLLLLERLHDVPETNRGATFRSVIAFAGLDGREWTAEDSVLGLIATSLRGSHGFGYDPLFIVPELERTYAELLPAEKDPISHRGKALAASRYHIENELRLLE